MKTIKQYREEGYYSSTAVVSELVRKLSFALIAIVWAFKAGSGGSYKLSPEFAPALFWTVFTLALDLSQYLLKGFMWDAYCRKKEREMVESDWNTFEFPAPSFLNYPSTLLYYAKAATCLYSYWLLIGVINLKFLG